MNDWTAFLKQLIAGEPLTVAQSQSLMAGWLDGLVPAEVSGALLATWQCRGVTAAELAALAQVLLSQSAPDVSPLRAIDTCGTGGDGADTFNISTAVAFVVAAAGVKVAKHGNRAVSSRSGSADVLEALGVNVTAAPDRIRHALDEVGITFLFAPHWHPAMKAVAPVRKALKIRTVFNLLGPLVNPLQPTMQVLGVYHRDVMGAIAGALQSLGRERAVVLHSREGLDEVGLGGVVDLVVLSGQEISHTTLDPQDFGIAPTPLAALRGGTVRENATILQQVLQGQGTPAQQQCVALNSAIALWVAGVVPDWHQGYTRAQELMASGAPWQTATNLIAFLPPT
jgi:anthranilate phosphoribosyltransferase